jgi:methionyl-tRNA formyltransferase/acyl carrier protein
VIRERGHEIAALASDDPTLGSWAVANRVTFFTALEPFLEAAFLDHVDFLFSIANPRILDSRTLLRPRSCCINFHNGPLPRYAGVHATSWAIFNGETTHGVTWHVMSEAIDAGDIVKQVIFRLGSQETTLTLNLKCYESGLRSFRELVRDIEQERVRRRPQDLSARTYYRLQDQLPAGGFLRWDRPAEEIDRLWRALEFGSYHNDLAVARTVIRGRVLVVRALAVSSRTSGAPPGTVGEASPLGARIATATRDVVLRKLARPDRLPLADDPRVVPCSLRPGDRLQVLDEAATEHLQGVTAWTSRHETAWLDRLKRVSAGTRLRTGAAAASDRITHTIDVAGVDGPGPVDVALAAAVVVCRRLLGLDPVAILYQDHDTRRPNEPRGLFFPFLLLTFDLDDHRTLQSIVFRVAEERRSARERGPFLADLLLRSPVLRTRRLHFRAAFVHADATAQRRNRSGSDLTFIVQARDGPVALQVVTRSTAREPLPPPNPVVQLWRRVIVATARTPDLPLASLASTADRQAEGWQGKWTRGARIEEAAAAASQRPERKARRSPYMPPETAVERRLALIWADLLGEPDLGTEDDFFRLGGDSLLVVRLAAAVRKQYGIELPLMEIFARPTIAALAPEIRRRLPGWPSARLTAADDAC